MKIGIHLLLLMVCQAASAKTLLVPQVGHSEPINHLGFSPSGRFLSSSSDDMSVRVWAMDGNIVSLLDGHETPVVQSVFLSDKYLISVDREGIVYAWDILSQEKIKIADFDGIVPSLGRDLIGLAQDNSHIAIAGFRSFHWAKIGDSWGPDSPLKLNEVRVNFNIDALAISPSGRFIAAANKIGYFYLYDTVAKAELYSQMLEPVFTRAAFVNDEYVALAGRGVSLFEIESKKIVSTIDSGDLGPIEALAVNPADGAITAIADKLQSFAADDSKKVTLTAEGIANTTVAYSPDGKKLAVVDQEAESCYADGTQIRITDLEGKEISRFAPGLSALPKTALFADDLLAISACTQQVQVWDLKKRKLVQNLAGLPSPVEMMTVDADNGDLLLMGVDNSLNRWRRSHSEKPIEKIWQGLNFAKVDFSPVTGQVAYTEHSKQDIKHVYLDSLSGDTQRQVLPKAFTANIDVIKFSPSGEMITVQTEHDGILAFEAFFDVPETNDLISNTHSLGRIGSFGSPIVDYAFNPISERVVVVYEDKVELWSTQSFTKMNVTPTKYTGINKIHFSKDGSKFGLIAFRKIIIFNASDLKVIRDLDGVVATSLYFINDDKNIAVINRDARIDIYDIEQSINKIASIQNINNEYGYSIDKDGHLLSVVDEDVYQPVLRKTYTEDDMTLEVIKKRVREDVSVVDED